MSPKDNLKVNSRIVFREECGEALLFDPESGNVKVLNETGKFIWKNLNGNNNKDSLVKKIMEAFDSSDDEKKIKEDLEAFLEDLAKLKFIAAP